MKKKIIAILFCCIFSLVGCGTNQESVEIREEKELTEIDSNQTIDALGGVYSDGNELKDIPMGTCLNGEQIDLVNVKMPLNYMFGAIYIDNGEEENFKNASGGTTLETALNSNFLEEPYAVKTVIINSNKENLRFMIGSDISFEQFKTNIEQDEFYSECTEIPKTEAFYYIDKSEYAKENNLTVAYKINNEAYLIVMYNGPLMKSLGAEQLANNIYNLIGKI